MSDRRVALTFDAEHPSRRANRPDGVERILDALGAAGARATFFVQGRWASAFPTAAARIAAEGHLVGNHSHYHAPMSLLTAGGIEEDVRRAEERVGEATGADPRPWFRCPFGRGADDRAVAQALERLGYRDVGWDVDPNDWSEARSPQDVEGEVLEGVRRRTGDAIVLLHTWPAGTAEALPAILAALRADGASLVTVDEVFRGP